MFVKLFGTLLNSSIWDEDAATRLVWITLLLMADEEGYVRATEKALCRQARVTQEDCRRALKVLSGPDLATGTQDYGGRRVEAVEGGWLLLNYMKYREIRTKQQIQAAARQQRFRDRDRDSSRPSHTSDADHGDVTPVTTEAEAEAEGEEKQKKTTRSAASNLPVRLGLTGQAVTERIQEVFAQVAEATETRLNKDQLRRLMVATVFSYWSYKMKHPKALLDPKREARIRARLKESGDKVDELLYAIDGWFRDKVFQEQADGGKKLDDIDNIFRDRSRVERLAGHCKGYNEDKPHKLGVKLQEAVGA